MECRCFFFGQQCQDSWIMGIRWCFCFCTRIWNWSSLLSSAIKEHRINTKKSKPKEISDEQGYTKQSLGSNSYNILLFLIQNSIGKSTISLRSKRNIMDRNRQHQPKSGFRCRSSQQKAICNRRSNRTL